ncbi:MAG: pyridoxal-phosphate dependent enzyme [Anaerolineales bacterium]|nr:pyridoxal-phosphate dependent enzyme [Anaerolineales bacterium]
MIPYPWIDEAAHRIAPHVRATPITYDRQNDLYIKWENRQVTGSFKARGTFNKILILEDWERQAGLLAASAGNHGQGVALAAQTTNVPATIYAPEEAPTVKINAMRELGADVRLIPGGYGEAERIARKQAEESHATWVSPYNDGLVIAGQGTLALEAIQQLEAYPEFAMEESVWVVPVSGGGLVAGVGAAIKNLPNPPRLVAVQTEAEPFMHALYYQDTQDIQVEAPTIADGLSGPVEENSITIPLIREYVDEIVLVSEKEIIQAIATAWHQYGERIEAAGAVVLAAALSGVVSQRPAILVISGGNIEPKKHQEIVTANIG